MIETNLWFSVHESKDLKQLDQIVNQFRAELQNKGICYTGPLRQKNVRIFRITGIDRIKQIQTLLEHYPSIYHWYGQLTNTLEFEDEFPKPSMIPSFRPHKKANEWENLLSAQEEQMNRLGINTDPLVKPEKPKHKKYFQKPKTPGLILVHHA